MRKVYSLLFAAVATFAAVSCNKEVAPSDNLVEDVVVFTAGFDEQTRTTINQEGKSLWEKSDKITIHNGTKGYEFTADMAGRFVPFTYAGNDFAGDKFMAVYPAGEYTVDLAAKTVNANIPTWQEARANSWNHNAALAVAYTENDKLYFKNAVALIKFTVMGEKVTHVYFTGNNGEVVTGNVLVSLNADNTIKSVVGTSTDEASKTAEIYGEPSSPVYVFKDNTTYYLAVIPQNFANGFTVKQKVDGSDDLKDVLVYDKPYDLKPNTVLNIGTVHGVEQTWAVACSFNEWNTTANPMTREGAYYVLKGVTGLNYTPPTGEETGSSTGFKFVVNGTDWKGSVGEVAAGAWEYVWDAGNGSNIYVKDATADAAYDIYVNPSEGDNGKFVVVPAGTAMPEDKAPTTPETEASTPGLDSEWALAGTFNNWGNVVFKTTAVKGVFVAEKVALSAYDEIKVKAADNWDTSFGGGIKNLEQNKWMTVYDNGSNIPVVTEGSYDIYFDSNNNKLYLMVAGTSYSTAVEQKEDGPAQAVDSWYIVGNFNGWNPGDANYKMTVEGDCYVFDNFTAENGCEMKFAPGKWSGDKGGNKDFAADTWLNTGGDNISVEAGTYKIYLKNDQSQYKFEKK